MLIENYNLNTSYSEAQKKIISTIKTLNKERFVTETGIYGKKKGKYYKLFYRFRKVVIEEINPRAMQEDFTINQMHVRLSIVEINLELVKLQFELIDKTDAIKKQAMFLGAPIIILLIWFLSLTCLMSLDSYNLKFETWFLVIISTVLSIGVYYLIYKYAKKLDNFDKKNLFRKTVDTFMSYYNSLLG